MVRIHTPRPGWALASRIYKNGQTASAADHYRAARLWTGFRGGGRVLDHWQYSCRVDGYNYSENTYTAARLGPCVPHIFIRNRNRETSHELPWCWIWICLLRTFLVCQFSTFRRRINWTDSFFWLAGWFSLFSYPSVRNDKTAESGFFRSTFSVLSIETQLMVLLMNTSDSFSCSVQDEIS